MKNIIIIFSFLITFLSYGTNNVNYKEENKTIGLCKKIESFFLHNKKVLACEAVTSTTSVINSDGSITTTTITTVSCDTPQELATFNALLHILTEL